MIEKMKYDRRVLRWRIGISYLVEGFSLWRKKGDTAVASHKLITAKMLLEKTGDYMDEANVLQGLGCIRRTEGDHKASLQEFMKALELYEKYKHLLNKSRTLAGIGRTYLRLNNPEESSRYLKRALEICEREPRQKAEVLINMSWLFLQMRDEENAEKYASKALKEAQSPEVNSRELQAEAMIARGSCYLKKDDIKAIEELSNAIKLAQTPKLKINAHLSLASALLNVHNFVDAQRHISDAERMLAPNSGISSIYLSDKLDSVKKDFDELRGHYYLVSFDEIAGKSGDAAGRKKLKDVIKELEKWAIEKALEESNKNIEQAADKLGMSGPAFWQRKKRAGL